MTVNKRCDQKRMLESPGGQFWSELLCNVSLFLCIYAWRDMWLSCYCLHNTQVTLKLDDGIKSETCGSRRAFEMAFSIYVYIWLPTQMTEKNSMCTSSSLSLFLCWFQRTFYFELRQRDLHAILYPNARAHLWAPWFRRRSFLCTRDLLRFSCIVSSASFLISCGRKMQ